MSDVQSRLAEALSGRYTLERELGRGGMSIVYLAYDERLRRKVALKILRPELAATLGPDRFLREITLVAGLAHPHILPLHDSGEAAGMLYYVMPYVDGESLRHRLAREGRLPLEDALEITREVADALEYAHQHDIVHRDIKPENILLQAGQAIVSDFGIARAISEARGRVTSTGVAVGTPEYMSPEQASGGTVDGRTDVYSLGCVLYEMLSGRSPGTASGGAAQPLAISALQPAIPIEVEIAVKEAMAQRPEERFPRAADFARALREPGMATVSGARRRRRLRRLWSRAGMVAGLLVAGVVVWQLLAAREAVVSGSDPSHIAVLPFDDRSANGELRQVAAGMTDELVQDLAQVEALHVPSLNQIRALHAAGRPIDSVLRALDVGTYVEGFVTGSSTHPRVTARLVDVGTGQILAAFAFDRPRGDLLRVRDELVTDLARALRERLGQHVLLRASRAEATNVDAWVLTRRSAEMFDYARRVGLAGDGAASRRGFDQADSLAAQAAQLDSRWAEPVLRRGWIAWARAVAVASAEMDTDVGRNRQVARLRDGLRFADQALQRRRDDPRALELRGFLRFRLWELLGREAGGADTLLAQSESDLRAAVQGNPGLARAWSTLSQLLGGARGEHLEAEAAARKALEKDAYLADAETIVGQLFRSTLERGDFTEAERWCREGQARFPGNPNFLECQITLLGWAGRTARDISAATKELARLDTIPMLDAGRPFRELHLAAILARGGRRDSALAVMRTTRRRYPDEPLGLPVASVFLLVGERDSALATLTTLLRAHPTWREYVANHYWLRALQSDARFRALTADSTP